MNSTRTATLSLWVTLTCLVGFGMFVMKNQVQNLENELASINRNIEEDVKTIHILKAEWSHLNTSSLWGAYLIILIFPDLFDFLLTVNSSLLIYV